MDNVGRSNVAVGGIHRAQQSVAFGMRSLSVSLCISPHRGPTVTEPAAARNADRASDQQHVSNPGPALIDIDQRARISKTNTLCVRARIVFCVPINKHIAVPPKRRAPNERTHQHPAVAAAATASAYKRAIINTPLIKPERNNNERRRIVLRLKHVCVVCERACVRACALNVCALNVCRAAQRTGAYVCVCVCMHAIVFQEYVRVCMCL